MLSNGLLKLYSKKFLNIIVEELIIFSYHIIMKTFTNKLCKKYQLLIVIYFLGCHGVEYEFLKQLVRQWSIIKRTIMCQLKLYDAITSGDYL